nr:hypothetical protein [Tanacetum cinerariifolium]
MMLTFVETHNMIAYLTKSDASEGFNQIINFLNESSIKYALTVNPNIYVSCIKQFWTSVAVKKVNDVTRLQALVDKKKVIITKASHRDALRLDDAKGVECLPNEEIFTEFARIGYEKPSTKLTFYKAFFSSQWKFLIHTILQCMSANRTSWNEFSFSMASAVICLSTVGDLSTHTTKYTSLALTQKVFANMRQVRKGFSGVETPLFEGMIVEHQVDEGDAEVNVDDVSTAGVSTEGDVSAANDQAPTADDEPSIPSPTPPTPPPQPSQDVPLTSRKLERRNKASKLKRIKRVSTAQRIDTSDDTVMDEVCKQGRMIDDMDADGYVVLEDDKEVVVEKSTDVDESADVQGSKAESQAQIYHIDLEHANKALNMQDDEGEPAELQEVVEILKKPATPSTIIYSKAKSKDKGKGILVEEPKPLKKQAQIKKDEKYARELDAELNKNIDWDEVIDHVQRNQKEDKVVKRYKALKRKPQTEAQARKNMMIYLRNVVGFKMDYFKRMTYDDIRLIFEKHFDSNIVFLQKTKEQMDEEDSRALKRLNESQEDMAAKKQKLDEEVEELKRHLQIVPNDEDDVYTEATPLARKVPVVDYEIYNENNKPYYKIKRADGLHQLYLSFLSLLRNFDNEDMETL